MFSIIVSCFLPLLRLFLQMGLGYVSYKRKWLSKETAKEFSGYCMNVLMPLYLVGQISHDMSPEKLGYFIPTLTNYLLLLGTGYSFSVILFKKLSIPAHLHNPIKAMLMFSNNFLFPIMVMNGMCQSYGFLYGDDHCRDADFYVVCYIPIGNSFLWTYGLYLFKDAQKIKQASCEAQPLIELEEFGHTNPQNNEPKIPESKLLESDESFSLRRIKQILSNVCNSGFIATAIGMALGLLPFTRPLFLDESAPLKVFMDAINIVGGVCIPIINIIIGYNMAIQSESISQSHLTRKDQIVILAVKFIATPLIGVIAVIIQQGILPGYYENNTVLAYTSYLQWMSPMASVVVLFSIVYDVGSQEISLFLYLQMLLALPMITINSAIFIALS